MCIGGAEAVWWTGLGEWAAVAAGWGEGANCWIGGACEGMSRVAMLESLWISAGGWGISLVGKVLACGAVPSGDDSFSL